MQTELLNFSSGWEGGGECLRRSNKSRDKCSQYSCFHSKHPPANIIQKMCYVLNTSSGVLMKQDMLLSIARSRITTKKQTSHALAFPWCQLYLPMLRITSLPCKMCATRLIVYPTSHILRDLKECFLTNCFFVLSSLIKKAWISVILERRHK